MKLWLRARRAWWLIVALLAMLTLDTLVGGISLGVPALFGGGASFVFIRTYLPLLWTAAIADAFAGPGLSIEARPTPFAKIPVSQLGLLDAALFMGSSALAAVVFSVFAAGNPSGAGPVLVLSGVTCIATLRSGPALGVFASTMLMLLTSTYPRTAPGARFVHILQPDGQPTWSTICGLVACLIAAGMLATNSAVTRLRAGAD